VGTKKVGGGLGWEEGNKRGKEKSKRGGKKEGKRKKQKTQKGRRGVYGGRGAWGLRRVGPHTNNTRLT